MSAQDPFYLVKEEIQESVDNVQASKTRLEKLSINSSETENLLKELSAACDSVEWQIDELNRAIMVAERDPVRFGIDNAEIESRKKWTSSTIDQVKSIKKVVQRISAERSSIQKENARRELLRMDDFSGGGGGGGASSSSFPPKPDSRIARANEEFLGEQEDRQSLLLREQDAHLDEMSESLAKIGGMGIAIHDELGTQNKIIEDLERDVDSTHGRLEVIQKKMVTMLKKAGMKGQLIMIFFLSVLLIILVFLIFS